MVEEKRKENLTLTKNMPNNVIACIYKKNIVTLPIPIFKFFTIRLTKISLGILKLNSR